MFQLVVKYKINHTCNPGQLLETWGYFLFVGPTGNESKINFLKNVWLLLKEQKLTFDTVIELNAQKDRQ